MIRFAVPALLSASVLAAACGASPSVPALGASGGTTAAQSEVAHTASEPRSSDVTAATPASTTDPPPTPARFGNLGMTSSGPATAPDPNGSNADAPKKISARHVLVQWMGSDHAPTSVVRSKDQAFKVANEVLRRAQAKEDFARLAVEYSDEPNAGQRGGSVGRFGHGQMVPEFETAAFKLKVGEISGIVESPFGFHVIQRTE